MGARTALVVVADRRAEVRPSRRRSEEEQLVERELPSKDVALGQRNLLLDVPRREHLLVEDDVLEVRDELRERIDHRIAEGIPLLIFVAVFRHVVAGILDEARHHVFAGRRHARIDHRRDVHVDVGSLRERPVLGVVVGLLDIVDTRADFHHAAQEGRVRHPSELRRGVESEIDLPRRAPKFELVDRADKVFGEFLLIDEFSEGHVGICGRRDCLGVDLLSIFERHADSPTILHDHLLDAGVAADFCAVALRRTRDGIAYAARTSLLGTPGREGAVEFSHVMVQEHVGGARRLDAELRTDDATDAHQSPDDVRLDPLGKKVVGAHRHDLRELLEGLLVEVLQVLAEILEGAHAAKTRVGEIRRYVTEDRLHRAHQLIHHLVEFRDHIGVALGVALDLLAQRGRVGVHCELVTVFHRDPGHVVRHDMETVLREFEFANDFRPQETHHVGKDRVFETWKLLLADGRTADEITLLQHQYLAPGLGEIGRTR